MPLPPTIAFICGPTSREKDVEAALFAAKLSDAEHPVAASVGVPTALARRTALTRSFARAWLVANRDIDRRGRQPPPERLSISDRARSSVGSPRACPPRRDGGAFLTAVACHGHPWPMPSSLWPLLLTGFLLGWSVAWPPGPINAAIARRCLAGGFWAGFSLLLGACSADALWAVLVSLGVGVVFARPPMREIMGAISVALLIALSLVFLRGAWRALAAPAPAAAPPRSDSRRAGFLLGAAMALTSPWNVAFWLAAIGRPEMAGYATPSLLIMAAAVIAGALSWGVIWSGSVVLLHRRADSGAAGRWWAFGVDLATGALMAAFAFASAARLIGG
jgi:threonine/homoserine/homoserine lactone efflux protein